MYLKENKNQKNEFGSPHKGDSIHKNNLLLYSHAFFYTKGDAKNFFK